MPEDQINDNVEPAIALTIAWLGNANTRVEADAVPAFLRSMHDAVSGLGNPGAAEQGEAAAGQFTPAMTSRKSLASKDHIISMIDGKPYRTLKRHLTTNGLTPQQYRERYNLKPDYPMVAESYSAARRDMAIKIGLGQKGRAARSGPAPAAKGKRGTPKT